MAITFKAGKPEANQFFVEPGDYDLVVVDAEEDTSSSGNDMIKLTLAVLHGDETKGPKLFDYLVFTEKALFKVDAFLQSAGKHPGEGNDINIDAADLIGLKCAATLKVEEYDGKKNNKVVNYLFDEF